MNTGIIVLGMPRGGTSLVADLVRRWGAYEGPEADLLAADHWNPQGYWELVALKRLNDELLASVGASERVPPTDQQLLEIANKASDFYYQQKAANIITSTQHDNRIWFWKDPRLMLLLPFWQRQWRDVVYVVVIRQPLDAIKSQQAMISGVLDVQYQPLSAALLYWQSFMITMLRFLDQHQRTIFVEYETLLQQPSSVCNRLCTFLDQHTGNSSNNTARLEAMTQAINVNLRHQRSSHSIFDELLATQDQKDLYHFLKRKVEDATIPFNPADFSRYPGWHEYLTVLDRQLMLALSGNFAVQAPNWHDAISVKEPEAV